MPVGVHKPEKMHTQARGKELIRTWAICFQHGGRGNPLLRQVRASESRAVGIYDNLARAIECTFFGIDSRVWRCNHKVMQV